MSHISYKTEAIVLGSENRSEVNKTIILFTPLWGVLYAHAQGVRFEKSKLRFSLCQYSIINVMLVRGKSGWRITNAVSKANMFYDNDKETMLVIARVLHLFQKLLAGEENAVELFELTKNALAMLSTVRTKEQRHHIEIAWVFKGLSTLGYVDSDLFGENKHETLEEWIQSGIIPLYKTDALKQIHRAMHGSQLIS